MDTALDPAPDSGNLPVGPRCRSGSGSAKMMPADGTRIRIPIHSAASLNKQRYPWRPLYEWLEKYRNAGTKYFVQDKSIAAQIIVSDGSISTTLLERCDLNDFYIVFGATFFYEGSYRMEDVYSMNIRRRLNYTK